MLEDILLQKLVEAGLHEKEAKVYFSLLLIGKGTLMDITRKACLPHASTYYSLKNLVSKKLIIKQQENKQKYYYISSPNHAFRNFEQHLEEELRKKKTALTEAIDGFNMVYYSLTDKPEVKFFQGPEAIKMSRAETFVTEFNQMYEFVNLDKSFQYAPPKKGDHRSKFRNAKLRSKSIYLTENGPNLPFKEKNVLSYYLPKGKYNFEAEIYTFADKILFTKAHPDRACVVIRDKEFAESMKNLFELALEGVLKYQPKNYKKNSKNKKYSHFFKIKKNREY